MSPSKMKFVGVTRRLLGKAAEDDDRASPPVESADRAIPALVGSHVEQQQQEHGGAQLSTADTDVENDARTNELARLLSATETLTYSLGGMSHRLTQESRTVLDRLRDQRFDVAIVGEYNRGKSTLLNRLVDRRGTDDGFERILPSGVLPVTAAVTELTYGEGREVKVRFTDGSDEMIDLTQVESYISEEANPGNKRNVDNVRIAMPSPMLRHGAVLVDTPGVGSIFRHNSETARQVIDHADAAIFVLSADAAITDAERSLIKVLAKRSQKTFFVLNRIDHLEPDDRQKVAWFVENVLREAFSQNGSGDQKLWLVSAKTGEGFDEFAGAVDDFLENELDSARARLARRDVETLADLVDNECALEESALATAANEIEDKVEHFRRSVDWQREAFDDDTVLFHNATTRIQQSVGERVRNIGADVDGARERIRDAVSNTDGAELRQKIEDAVEAEIRSVVEPIRRHEELEVERAWGRAAERLERATQRRAEKLREVASDLFSVELKPVDRVQPSNQRGRFFYSPAEAVTTETSSFGKTVARLFMSRDRQREQAIEAAVRHYGLELQRHMQRLRDDLAARVDDANRSLESSVGERVDQLGSAMTDAIERGQARKTANQAEQDRQKQRSEKLQAAARDARLAAQSTVIDTTQGESATRVD